MRLIYLIKRLTNKKNSYADESNLTLNVTFKITNLSRREGDKIKKKQAICFLIYINNTVSIYST